MKIEDPYEYPSVDYLMEEVGEYIDNDLYLDEDGFKQLKKDVMKSNMNRC